MTASLLSGEGDEAKYLEQARICAWEIAHKKQYAKERVVNHADGATLVEKCPEGWPKSLPANVMAARWNQLR